MKNLKTFTVLLAASLLSSTSVFAQYPSYLTGNVPQTSSHYAPGMELQELAKQKMDGAKKSISGYVSEAAKLAKEIQTSLNEKVSNKTALDRAQNYKYDGESEIPEQYQSSKMEDKVQTDDKAMMEKYARLKEIFDEAEKEYKSACGSSDTEDCSDLKKALNKIQKEIDDTKTEAEKVFADNSESDNATGGYIWLTKDKERFTRMQGIIDRTLEKNLSIQEQMAEIDNLVQNGIGSGGYIPQYSTGALNGLTANTQANICTDSILIAADQSAKKASQVYGEMLMPYTYPTKEEDIKLLEELKQRIYRNEIAYSLAISTYNLNRIANDTEKDLKELQDQSEKSKTQAEMIGANTKIVTRISEEVIPLIVNVSTTTTMEAIGAVKRVPRKDVIIK